jgi:hypothetical protein
MNDIKKVKSPGRDEVEVLGATYEEGQPEGAEMGKWNQKLTSRNDTLKYLQNGLKYFCGGEEGFGSEKRKTPA